MSSFLDKLGSNNKKARVVEINARERLGLRSLDGTVYIVAYTGKEERTICARDDYDKGLVKVYQDGKRVMITLQTVSR